MTTPDNIHSTSNRKHKLFPLSLRRVAAGVLILMGTLLPLGAAAEDIFAALADFPEVESSYVSGRFAHNQKSWRSASGQHAMNLSRGFSALYSYQCYSKQSVTKAKEILDNYLKKNPNVEMVMRTQQSGTEYVIYEKFGSDGKLYQMIIWSLDTPQIGEIVVVDWKDGLKPGGDGKYGEEDSSMLTPRDLTPRDYRDIINSLKYRPLL